MFREGARLSTCPRLLRVTRSDVTGLIIETMFYLNRCSAPLQIQIFPIDPFARTVICRMRCVCGQRRFISVTSHCLVHGHSSGILLLCLLQRLGRLAMLTQAATAAAGGATAAAGLSSATLRQQDGVFLCLQRLAAAVLR